MSKNIQITFARKKKRTERAILFAFNDKQICDLKRDLSRENKLAKLAVISETHNA